MTFDPDHYYYNHLGEPITLMEWTDLREGDNAVLREDEVADVLLRTKYLGFVSPYIHRARLFGTALLTLPSRMFIGELQLYDSETEAMVGHMHHLEAMVLGHHCHLCRIGVVRHH